MSADYLEVSSAVSTNKSFGATKIVHNKREEIPSFANFVSQSNADHQPKTDFNKHEDHNPKRDKETMSQSDSSLALKNKDDNDLSNNSCETFSDESSEANLLSNKDESLKRKLEEEEKITEEGIAIVQAVVVPINDVLLKPEILEPYIQEQELEISEVALNDIQQDIISTEKLVLDSNPVLLESDILKADLEKLQATNINQQNIDSLSNSIPKEFNITQTKQELISTDDSFDLNLGLKDLEQDQGFLLKSTESQSKEPSLLTQANLANTLEKRTQLLDENSYSTESELTDSTEISLTDLASRTNDSRDKPIIQKELVKIEMGNKTVESNSLIDDEILETMSFDEFNDLQISNFAVIDSSKIKPEISFDSGMISTNKTTIQPQEQLSLSLKYAVSQGKSEVTINLYPKALGAIDVKIEFATNSAGQTEVQKVIITADRSSTLKLLENTKSHLETALAELKKETATTVTESSKKEASLQFDMRGGSSDQSNEGYFTSFEERENWMNKFKNLTSSEDASSTNSQKVLRKNIHTSTNIDIEV
jgi:hypothetical protein